MQVETWLVSGWLRIRIVWLIPRLNEQARHVRLEYKEVADNVTKVV